MGDLEPQMVDLEAFVTGEQLQLREMRMVDLEQAEQERYERAIFGSDAEDEVEETRPWGQVEEGWGQVEEVEERPVSAVSYSDWGRLMCSMTQ